MALSVTQLWSTEVRFLSYFVFQNLFTKINFTLRVARRNISLISGVAKAPLRDKDSSWALTGKKIGERGCCSLEVGDTLSLRRGYQTL